MDETSDKSTYGFIGNLTKLHSEMVLAISYFSSSSYSRSCLLHIYLNPESRNVLKGLELNLQALKMVLLALDPIFKRILMKLA